MTRNRSFFLFLSFFLVLFVSSGRAERYFLSGDRPECSANADDRIRVDCFPELWGNQANCESRGCCWQQPLNQTNENVPYCFYPNNYSGYAGATYNPVVIGPDSISIALIRQQPSGFPSDFASIVVILKAINKYRAQITVKPQAPAQRWTPPVQLDLDYESTNESERLYAFDYDDQYVKVIRRQTNRTIWQMNYRNLILSDQWLQAETRLPSLNLFGLGEFKDTYRRNFAEQRKSYLFFSQGYPPIENKPLYSSQPIYLAYENDGQPGGAVLAHTVVLLNSNAMEAILSPGKVLVWRSIGGQLDFYINLGSTPQEAVSRYVSLVGKPPLPPYWSLGFHLCRYGFNNLTNMKNTYNRMKENSINLDVMWNDIDVYWEHNMFRYDNKSFDGLPEFIDMLHSDGVSYIPMLDPSLGGNYSREEYPEFYDGLERNAFIKTENDTLLKTRVWNRWYSVWTDFSSENGSDFWIEAINKLYLELPFEGLWLDMNSPDANGVDGSLEGCNWENKIEKPYFVPFGLEPLAKNTACMQAKHGLGRHYDIHNMYSYLEANVTNLALQRLKKRPFIISRSSFIGHGRFANKWTGDVSSTWQDLKISISNVLSFNIYGVPVVGADICGFLGNTNVELCARWQSLGAFYPFSRNHNDISSIDQDPPALGPLVVNATRYSLNIRYSLLSLLYTELWKSSVDGRPVVRAMSMVFPDDPNTYDIEDQFLWGDSVMIIPIVVEGATQTNAYLPAGIWYDYVKQHAVSNVVQKGTYMKMDIPLDKIGVLLRGGRIVFSQKPELTTRETRKSSFDLVVALDERGDAEGSLYWDDGQDYRIAKNKNYNLVELHAHRNALFNKIVHSKYVQQPSAKSIAVIGVYLQVKQVTINGVDVHRFSYDDSSHKLLIDHTIDLTKQFIIVWS